MSKTDKVGEIFNRFYDEDRFGTSHARHALLEVIKAELPKKDFAFGYTDMDIYQTRGKNAMLTEVNAILERLFLGEEK